MDLRAAARDVIESKGGIAKSADFVAAGIRAVDVVSLCNAGYLDRVRHGYYQMAEQNEATEEQMLVTLIPQGIVCVESALFCQNGRPVSGRIFRIVTFTAADRVRFYPCQYTVFGV